jgi:hypothetical protein
VFFLEQQINMETQQRVNNTRSRIETIKNELNDNNKAIKSANDGIRKGIHIRTKREDKLNKVRRELFDELCKYIFPIEQVSAIEE